MNVARSFKFQSHLSLKVWGDCVLTTIHLINRILTSVPHNKSPYEILFKSIPFYSHLRVFGCLCYANTLLRNKHKFDPRAKPFIFLGYPYGIKGYKFYDLTFKSVFVSRDVIFHETIFPYALKYPNSKLVFTDSVIPLPTHDPSLPKSVASLSNSMIPISSPNHLKSSTSCSNLFPSIMNFNSDQILDVITSNSNSVSPHLETPHQQLRKSSRVKQKPGYLHDYHCHIAASTSEPTTTFPALGIPYDFSLVLSYNKLSYHQKLFSLFVYAIVEPKSYNQAVKFEEWCEAMDNEIKALELNHT